MDADLDVDAAGADDSYLLSVSVTGANLIDLGEISVVIDVMGVNEAPVFDATDDYARAYLRTRRRDRMLERPCRQRILRVVMILPSR